MHRRLLEERAEELKVGAVLLLKQVPLAPPPAAHFAGVFVEPVFNVRLLPRVGRWGCFPPPIETTT